jgi:hypothetical protein
MIEKGPSTGLLRAAAILVLASLVLEAVSLRFTHPTAFIFFAAAAVLLLLPGIAIYLFWLVARRPDERKD